MKGRAFSFRGDLKVPTLDVGDGGDNMSVLNTTELHTLRGNILLVCAFYHNKKLVISLHNIKKKNLQIKTLLVPFQVLSPDSGTNEDRYTSILHSNTAPCIPLYCSISITNFFFSMI